MKFPQFINQIVTFVFKYKPSPGHAIMLCNMTTTLDSHETWPRLFAELPRSQVTRPTYFNYIENGKVNPDPRPSDPLEELARAASLRYGRQVMLFIGVPDELSDASVQANKAAGLGIDRVHAVTHPNEIVPVMAYPASVQQVA